MKISKYILTADNYEAIDYTDQWTIQPIKAGNIHSGICFPARFHEFSNTDIPAKLQQTSFRGLAVLDI
ncbi:hypothetical protein D3C87_38120 [compost metagenome]